jgi:hypothetical protein
MYLELIAPLEGADDQELCELATPVIELRARLGAPETAQVLMRDAIDAHQSQW